MEEDAAKAAKPTQRSRRRRNSFWDIVNETASETSGPASSRREANPKDASEKAIRQLHGKVIRVEAEREIHEFLAAVTEESLGAPNGKLAGRLAMERERRAREVEARTHEALILFDALSDHIGERATWPSELDPLATRAEALRPLLMGVSNRRSHYSALPSPRKALLEAERLHQQVGGLQAQLAQVLPVEEKTVLEAACRDHMGRLHDLDGDVIAGLLEELHWGQTQIDQLQEALHETRTLLDTETAVVHQQRQQLQQLKIGSSSQIDLYQHHHSSLVASSSGGGAHSDFWRQGVSRMWD